MLTKGYSFKAKSRASSGSIFQPKQSVPATSNPLEEEEKKYEAKKSKISPKRASSRIVSNVSFDPLSDPLSAGDSATLETVQDTQTRGQRKENEEHSGEWRRVRREVLTSHSSTSYTTNLPSITIRPGENSARHLTVQEFVVELEVKQEQMISRWAEDDRVEALKIIIQALKSLSDTTAIRFYPAKFFLVLDMVTAFVDLVEVRLLSLNSEAAQEVAKNWLYKISSIREMVPRFFLETAFTRFEGFYSGFKDDRTFARLSDTIRGLGNPLLAVYSRMFLSRVCSTSGELEVHTQRTHHQEISSVLNTLRSEKPKTFEKITFEDYVALLKPAVSWNTYLVTSLHSEGSLLALMKEMSYQTDQAAGLVLETFLNHLSGDFCSGNTQFLVSTCLNLPTANIMRGLGRALLRAQSGLGNKQELMNSCWSSVSQLDTLDQFLPSAAVWLEFAALHFQNRELNKLLGLVIKRINKDRREEDNLPPQFNDHLKDILVNVVRRRSPSVTGVFRIQNFLSVFSLITKEEVKAAAAKEVLEELMKEEIVPTGESVVLETVVSLTSVLGSSVTALTSRDEARQVSGLIVNGVVRCSLLPDTDQHLSLLTKLRDQFSHLDLVQAALVRQVNTLAASLGELSHRQVRQALAAFSYITIPSIRDTRTKMSLYLETAQVSMINSCLGQAEACCRALNTLLLEDLPPGRDSWLREFLPSYFSTILVIPDNPEEGVLFLIKSALNAINKYSWDRGQPLKCLALLDGVKLLASACQETYPYSYQAQTSNDKLYGHDESLVEELERMSSTLLDIVISSINTASQSFSNTVTVALLQTLVIFSQGGSDELLELLLQKISTSTSLSRREKENVARWCSMKLYEGEHFYKNIK